METFRGAVLEAEKRKPRPITWDFISTFAPKHESAIGESLGTEAIIGHLIGEKGEEVRLAHFDMQLDPLERIMSEMVGHKPDIIGISIKIGSLDQTDQIINAVNALSWGNGRNPLLVLGGVVPTFAPKELLQRYPYAILAIGEGEIAVQMLVEAVKGERSFEDIPGITFINEEGEIVANPHKLWPQSKLHLPARLTTERMHRELGGTIWAEDSRGCDYTCTFCSRRTLRGSGFSGDMTPERVVDDLEYLDGLGIHQVSFTGDDFGGDPERTYRIADEIIRREIDMKWFMTTRADHIFERKNTVEQNARLKEIMQHCVESGLVRVFLGLESGSQSQLKRYGKQITVEENYKAIEILRELRETLEFLEKTGMGLKVTNPLSILRVQVGSPYMKLIEYSGLLGEQTEDFLFYKAQFKDPRIELIAQIADKWVEDLYPLIYGLKGAIASVVMSSKDGQQHPLQNIEITLHTFRRLELDFLKSLVSELENRERINYDAVNTLRKIFIEKRKKLLDWVKKQLVVGSYGDVQTSRLLACFKEVFQ